MLVASAFLLLQLNPSRMFWARQTLRPFPPNRPALFCPESQEGHVPSQAESIFFFTFFKKMNANEE